MSVDNLERMRIEIVDGKTGHYLPEEYDYKGDQRDIDAPKRPSRKHHEASGRVSGMGPLANALAKELKNGN